MQTAMKQAEVVRVAGGYEIELFSDALAVEEPLEIRIGVPINGKIEHQAVSITMRTPGEDTELAAGFLFTEGILDSSDQIKEIRHCRTKSVPLAVAVGWMQSSDNGRPRKALPVASEEIHSNTIRVDLENGVDIDFKKLERHFYTTSSCGVCGKSSIEALHTGTKKITGHVKVDQNVIHGIPEILQSAQSTFEKTGGLHASALFNLDGTLDTIREDVGRHNALDKVIGSKFLAGELPLEDKILIVSGRASFELVQKALMAGIPILAAVGAPSSLAVELAKEFNMTLVGFVRDGRFNVYCVEERIATRVPAKNTKRNEMKIT